ncbi:mucolipin-3 isoform X2 [Folsomia candida]|uniref:Mucolipin-3 n=1 Tax=Folsomia candida TaxID=158441 RepID=A0A226D1L2_FOLCA|nr:mucolipin-3 isoform X2 [Folsomia candida]OXA38531.1 Mucolipin-3 [Folsomia candida]
MTMTRYGSVNNNGGAGLMSVSMSGRSGVGVGGVEGMTATTTNISSTESPLLDKMRRQLRYFFMNPLEKWETRRQFPYKLTIQLIKIFFVTFQLCLFASYRYASVNYTWDNKITFSHLFIKDWDTSREITSYPPTTGPLAVYTKADFYSYFDHAVHAYSAIEELAIGPYFYPTKNNTVAPMKLCIERYSNGVIFGFNESYVYDGLTENSCITLPPSVISTGEKFSLEEFLAKYNASISFDSLLEGHLTFVLKTVRFRDLGPFKSPDCFQFDIDIVFNNRDHDGQTLVTLEAQPTRLRCKGDANYMADNRLERIGRSGVNYIVIGMCTLSLVLCCRAIYRAQLLKADTISFFKRYFGQDLTVEDRLEFLNFWYLLIIVNDILIIVGSALKEQIENKELTGEAWNICSLLLGVGNLLVWFGVLRYLGFFRTYNVLILTMKRAAPNVMRFLICAILIYAGFTFCGWLILGPYHIKFATLSTTSECLFALINGDDMFATFAGMSSKSSLLWWFCRLYLYTFISLFIYVVLSLFIALIMDAYETIKLYYQEGFPRTALHDFITGPESENEMLIRRMMMTRGTVGGGDDDDLMGGVGPPSPPYSINTTCCHHMGGGGGLQHSMGGGGGGGGCCGSSHHSHSILQQSHRVLSRQSSTTELTAGGILDTIVERICGCHTNNNTNSSGIGDGAELERSTSDGEESQPLLNGLNA